jgi:hypothetical protein
MRLYEISPDILLEMSYTRKRAEGIITGLEYQINLHLLKLKSIDIPDQFQNWRNELETWFSTIAALRLKPNKKPAPKQFYYRILFDEPFGNDEDAVVARLQLLRKQYGNLKPDIDTSILFQKLETFHNAFADGCSKGTMNLNMVDSLISAFIS